MMYMRWTKSINIQAFPLTEEACYQYVKSCRIERAPATRAFEARKAWRLATILLGLNTSMDIFKSARTEGCIRRCYKHKRLTKRSEPINKRAVMALERACVHSDDSVTRSKAGFLRFCIGARARGGAAARIGQEPILDLAPNGLGYIDVLAHVHKRSNMHVESTRMGLEMSAHSWGLRNRMGFPLATGPKRMQPRRRERRISHDHNWP